MTHRALRPIYRDGRIYDVGDIVAVDDDQDRKTLIDQGSIAAVKAEPKTANKADPVPANKSTPTK